MKTMAALIVGVYATCALAKFTSPNTCPAVIFNAKSGKVRDDKNYLNGKAATVNDVLYISDLTGKGVSTVYVAANKNNWAADIVIKDGLMVIEAGAEYSVPQLVKDCGKNDCAASLDKKDVGFDYSSNKPVSCGKAKCAKTCNKHTCDYWGEEEDYSCKSLEEEYGCDCFGCKCAVDHEPCDNKLARKTCQGKTCDEWVLESGVTCKSLQSAFGCSCAGCACKDPPVCDAKAIKVCSDAYKKPCKAGGKGLKHTLCGACIDGYKSNGKGDCDLIITTPPPTTPPPTTKPPTTKTPTTKPPTTKPPTTKAGVPKDKCGNEIKKGCDAADFKGDGHCDDDNNNPGCDWDGGDCCGKSGKDKQYEYCSACKCLDCNGESGDDCVTKFANNVKCGEADYKGDGNCDDEHNNAFCGWDGGDCCGTKVVKTYCKECKCKDCTYKPKEGDKCVKSIGGTCGSESYKGDGNCDDENNNAGCDWDGGDCCGSNLSTKYCTKCQCLDCTKQPSCPKKGNQCGDKSLFKDNFCDDENNNCGCGWDGGDCCGAVNKKYCEDCSCKDPNYKPQACGSAQHKGDGYCDDSNNVASCDFDGGDCCGSVKKNYCSKCACLDPNYETKCGEPDYKGDKNCDDANNNKACDWDGGDCCGAKVGKAYCTECKCKDPNASACGSEQYKGDGNCDDENNVADCDFDGGDCCGSNVKKAYCEQCKCLDPNYKPKDPNCPGSCGSANYKGDGNCDDENNNCGCAYDGGDCCKESVGGPVKKDYCKACVCKDPKHKAKGCDGSCGEPKYVDDGNCDDVNNNCGCGYDGGDCCPKDGKKVVKDYCTVCKCLEKNE